MICRSNPDGDRHEHSEAVDYTKLHLFTVEGTRGHDGTYEMLYEQPNAIAQEMGDCGMEDPLTVDWNPAECKRMADFLEVAVDFNDEDGFAKMREAHQKQPQPLVTVGPGADYLNHIMPEDLTTLTVNWLRVIGAVGYALLVSSAVVGIVLSFQVWLAQN